MFVRAVCSAETEVDEALGASSGAPFTGTIPDSIPEIVCMRILWCATRFRLFADPEKASARLLHKDSDVRLARIAKRFHWSRAEIRALSLPELFQYLSFIAAEKSIEDTGRLPAALDGEADRLWAEMLAQINALSSA